MPLPTPKFDSRTYREILNEALARIPSHNPEWNNYNDSDPGVTLLQLFAFMTENLLYRANLIPDRNRQKFLQLLGLGMQASQSATGIVAFSNPKGILEAKALRAEHEVNSGKVPFRLTNGLDVLPIESRLYYKSPIQSQRKAEVAEIYSQLYASFDTSSQNLDFYETRAYQAPSSGVTLPALDLAADTYDGIFWLALLARANDSLDDARKAIAGKELALGIVPAMDAEGCALYPIATTGRDQQPAITFEIPNVADTTRLSYRPLRAKFDDNPLLRPAVVKLSLPEHDDIASWDEGPLTAGVGVRPPFIEETDDADRLLTWVRIRVPQLETTDDTSSKVSAAISWVGINAGRVVQRTQVKAESLSPGNGEPDQTRTLMNKPVLSDSLVLLVNGEQWQEIDDLYAAAAEVPPNSPRFAGQSDQTSQPSSKVFSLDKESGQIRFGDGIHGARPPAGAVIQASYAYGGGTQGMVGIGSINKGAALPAGVKVNNPVPTWGGREAETVEQAEKRIPQTIKHRNRLVSKEDFEQITWQTPGVKLGRVEVLPLFHPKLPRQLSQGAVTVMVIPKEDPVQPQAPVPDRMFLQTVCTHLAPRRILTSEVHVHGPIYVPIWVAVGVETVPGFDQPSVRDDVAAQVEQFLSPLNGGFAEDGWPMNKSVDGQELLAAAARVSGVAKINALHLATATTSNVSEISIEGLQLPYLRNILVAEGDAPSIEEVRGESGPQRGVDQLPTGPDIVPVPVIPDEC